METACFGWKRTFEQKPRIEDIPDKVGKLEQQYWLWLAFSIVLGFCGVAMMLSAPQGDLRRMLLGLFMAVDGAIFWAVLKVVVHVRLAMYRTLWEARQQARN